MWLRTVAAALGWLASGVALDAHAAPPAVDFDIPAGSLVDSLDQFGEQSGLQVVYDFALIGDRHASAIVGVMPPREALDRFLAGSGLAWSFVNDGTVVLRPAVAQRAQARRTARTRAPRLDDQGNALTGITVVGSSHGALPNKPSAASFGLDKSVLATPRSVSLVSVETIDLLGLSAVEDLVRVVPGVYTTTRWGIQGSIDVRNVPADTYFRGMKRLNLQGHGRSVLAAMETIEIVKGPPSPIFGMGKIGGYTNMVPKSVRAAERRLSHRAAGLRPGDRGLVRKIAKCRSVSADRCRFEHEQGGYYLYGLFEDSDTFIERVPVGQRVLQGAVSRRRRDRRVSARSGRELAALAHGRRIDRPLHAGARGHGALHARRCRSWTSTRTTTAGSAISKCTRARPCEGASLRATRRCGSTSRGRRARTALPLPLEELPSVAGIPQSLYDYLVAAPGGGPDRPAARAGTGRTDADLGLRPGRVRARSAHRRVRHARSAPRRVRSSGTCRRTS